MPILESGTVTTNGGLTCKWALEPVENGGCSLTVKVGEYGKTRSYSAMLTGGDTTGEAVKIAEEISVEISAMK